MNLDLCPYAAFAFFVNFQHRFANSLKFKNHILQPAVQDCGGLGTLPRGFPPGTCWRTPRSCSSLRTPVRHVLPLVAQAGALPGLPSRVAPADRCRVGRPGMDHARVVATG